ncbi:MAG: putative metal-binding motif-containing protein [Deltaproteobacteria bacterium]|nr:putative metal-binding motif-containing protein [Deltaproteobacteria bacterium]
MSKTPALFVVVAGLVLEGCGAAPDGTPASGGCPPGTSACAEGCCAVCQLDEDCGKGFGCCGSGQCSRDCDPCGRIACDDPPAAACVDANTLRTYGASGLCVAGECQYASVDSNCAAGCDAATHACKPGGDPGPGPGPGPGPTDLCAGVVCNQPPASHCASATSLRTYAATGTCGSGTCTYASIDTACVGGCSGNVCDTCVDPTCQASGYECGAPPNPCGGTLSCGSCSGGKVCNAYKCICPDKDGDGYRDAACGGNDCNDADPALHGGQGEKCDGIDNNCDGQVDEGAVLPSSFNSLAWVPAGYLGLGGGALLTWDGYGALWDKTSGKISLVFTLKQLWDAFGTAGTQPPTTAIDSMVLVPKGKTLGADFAAETLLVTAGANLYLVDVVQRTWSSMPVTAAFPYARVDWIILLHPGDVAGLAMTEDWLVAGSGNVLSVFAASTGWSASDISTSSIFCAGASTGCPGSYSTMTVLMIDGGPLLLVNSGSVTKGSAFNASFVFSWVDVAMNTISCKP